jgi:N12 class adenine-specific DNA methylase/predicted RNA methylase
MAKKLKNENQFNLFSDEYLDQLSQQEEQINNLENTIKRASSITEIDNELDLKEEEYKYVYNTRSTINSSQTSATTSNNNGNNQQQSHSQSRMDDNRQMVHTNTTENESIRKPWSGRVNDRSNATTRNRAGNTDDSNSIRNDEEWNSSNGNITNEWNQHQFDVPEKILTIAEDYIINEGDLNVGGAKSKFKHNIEAIKILNKVNTKKREATLDEKQKLIKYSGWGGIPQAFDPINKDWKSEYIELTELLATNSYQAAKRSTQDAHYTNASIIKGIYKGLQILGFTGGKVLEPSSGIGNFIGLMPPEMKANTKFTCIEMDQLTYQIGELLYPQNYHINKPFQDVIIRSNSFDAVVGNPPYGSQRVFDINHQDLSNLPIHNYFIAKSIDKLKEGGVFGVVVSRFFLDSKDTTLREKIAEQANFLGAIRLPNQAFKENAMTEVTTDIVFFQKLRKGETSTNKNWIGIGEIKDWENNEIISVNEYYANNPEQMIGKMRLVLGQYEHYELVNENEIDIEKEISTRLNILPKNIYTYSEDTTINNNLPKLNLNHLKVGSYFVTPSGEIAEKLPDELDNSNYSIVEVKNNKQYYRIVEMINIRDLTKKLIDLEKDIDSDEIEIESTRKELNFKYDRFIKQYGYLNSQVNVSLMKNDTEHALLIALESNYNKGISADLARKNNVNPVSATAEKADIFVKRVNYPVRKITKAENAYDAYTISMNEYGKADLQYMHKLTGMPIDDIKKDLKGHIFLNPANLEWESATKYLSGNVKEKLKLAEQKAETDPIFYENVDALRDIIPADVEAIDIAVQLGSPWIPAKYIKDFAAHLLGGISGEINYSESLGKWICKISSWDYTKENVTYGSTEMGASTIIERILANKKIEIKEKIDTEQKSVVNEEKTAEVLQKAELIKQEFIDWIWTNEARRKHLTKIYNDKFNHTIPPKYENSPLKLNTINSNISLRKNQLNAIFRFIENGGGLLDHTVGAGKTFTMLAIAIESKRMGLVNKPMLVVPNHLLTQWMNEAKRLYPNANLLIANKDDFTKERRQRLFANIATNDWDAVIISHSSLKKIAMPQETLKNIVEEQVTDLTNAIITAKTQVGNRIIVKEMEKMKERLALKMQKQAKAGDKDDFIYFDQLGIDQLLVDELQEFKNLQIVTSLNNIAGLGNLTGSDKAFDLFVKVRYLQQKYGKGFFGGTGTPISNTIAEVFTLQRYFQYDELKKAGLHHFDAWASTFGSIQTSFELDSTGVNYKLTTRFSKFQNVPELISQYKTDADTVLLDDLQKQEKLLGKVFPIPKIKGGRPQNIIVERSPLQEEYIGKQITITDEEGTPITDSEGNDITVWNEGSIIYRMEHIPVNKREDNALKITSDARKAGLDMRLIDPSAPDYEGSKINKAVEEIYRIYDEWKEKKGTQLVFCDLSTPKNNKKPEVITELLKNNEGYDETTEEISLDDILSANSKFSVYDDVKNKLIAKGIPENEIAFIHDANTDIKKEKLFKNVNDGQVRILMGSTTKMGAGTNVQQRLVALHHLDCPWRPSDLEQREGRIIRQGNLFFEADPNNFEVEILRYATKQTYDSRQWQTIETKARSIEQFRKGSMVLRTIEDISGEAANAAEMKAAASGNPLVLTQVNISSELKKMEALYSSHMRNQHFIENTIFKLEKTIQQAPNLEQQLIENIKLSKGPKTLIAKNGNTIERNKGKELHAILIDSIKAAQTLAISRGQLHSKVNIGTYRGFDISVRFNSNAVEFGITGKEGTSYPTNLKYDRTNPLSASGFFVKVDNYIDSFNEKLEIERERNISNIKKLEGLKNEIGKPFKGIEILKALREDNINVIKELRRMQKEKDYVSNWTPSYLKINENQESQKKQEYQTQEPASEIINEVISRKRLKL